MSPVDGEDAALAQVNWDDLRYFLALFRAETPVAAANMLSVDHTTVRRRLKALEEVLDAKLFDRRDNRYSLTTNGERLLEAAEAVESVIVTKLMETFKEGQPGGIAGPVRVGAPDGFGSFFLAPRLAQFQKLNPGVSFELVAMSRQFNLSKREADIAIVVSRPTQGNQFIKKLIDCRMHLCASRSYLESAPPIRRLEDLPKHRFVGYIDEFGFVPEHVNNLAHIAELRSPAFSSTNLVAQLSATREGAGICLLPRYMIQDEPEIVEILDDKGHISWEIWLITHSDFKNLNRFRAVASFISDEIRKNRHLFS